MEPEQPDLQGLGMVERLAVAVAGQAITGYLQFQALAELLINRQMISRGEWESHYRLMLAHELEGTIDAWFPPDIAAHVKQAMREHQDSERAAAGGEEGADA